MNEAKIAADKRRTKKMLSVLIPATVIMIILAVLAGIYANKAGNKTAVSGDKFVNVITNAGFKVYDIMGELEEENIFKSAYAVEHENGDFTYFLEFKKKGNAKSYFASVARKFKTEVNEAGIDNSDSKDYENYCYYAATVNGKYLHIVRVKNTVIYAEVSEDNMNSVQTIVNKIKY